jgi:hypothetical protein
MNWAMAERASLVASAGLLIGCAAIGLKFVDSPYFKGYASAAGGFFVLSRVAASFR